ncbi:hypothetical protein [Streptomyces prasinopilosus]|uniref:hypothetical protein n=1 Tax=Streptomyces prasinopilosus TaxID=67344 RepID=UPI0006EBC61C|nr:hypothetical protein [Streptomyces prasinopilosus]
MQTLTTRELRVIAAILDGLNKARTLNTRMGVPTTPDAFPARFPTGHVFVLRWTEGVQSSDPKRKRIIEQAARHRDGYVLDLATPADFAAAVQLQDPQPAKRGTSIRVDLRGEAENLRDSIRRTIRED